MDAMPDFFSFTTGPEPPHDDVEKSATDDGKRNAATGRVLIAPPFVAAVIRKSDIAGRLTECDVVDKTAYSVTS